MGDAPTIQAGIDSATSGDSVVVAAGLYNENLLIPTGKEICLRGLDGAEATVVDGGRRTNVLVIRGGGGVEGLTLRNGLGNVGGGIALIGSRGTLIRDNIIEDNESFNLDFGSGGGVYTHWDTDGLLFESNIIRNNTAGENGGGMHLRGGFVTPHIVRRNVITGNDCYLGGGGISISTPQAHVLDNVIANNYTMTAGGGIYVGLDGGGEIRGNTIVGNRMGYNDGGAGIELAGSPLISHNIIVKNTGEYGGGAGISCGGASAHPIIVCNDIWDNTQGTVLDCDSLGSGNFSADPVFCDASQGKYELAEFSPCLPANNGCAALIGAVGAGCTVSDVHEAGRLVSTLSVSPNPPRSQATITYSVSPAVRSARLTVYDLRGRVVRQLSRNAVLSRGTATWDGRDKAGSAVSAGIYIVRLETDAGSVARKIAWIR